ncbi:MAG TPA: histidinol dehydrogenase [Actinobacteria bacterium]|nr:histidinol dehydrogenase [Actinomycetota bacterium]
MERNDLKVIRISSLNQAQDLFKNHFEIPAEVMESANRIVMDVIRDGEEAALRYCNKFDNTSFKSIEDAIVTSQEIENGYNYIRDNRPELVKAIDKSYSNILRFHEEQLKNEAKTWYFEPEPGKKLGQIASPLERICVYVPGGRYVYPSSVLMTVIPARVAGVKEIAVCTPSRDEGKINELLLYIFRYLDIDEVYKISGAQAIALMAYGGSNVKRVSKIVGPGNIYVTAAKKIVFGKVGIDSLAGPSEVVIIADSTANPDFVASDLLSQAEHDPDAKSILLTDNSELADKAIRNIFTQIYSLKKEYDKRFNSELVLKCIKDNCKIIVCTDIRLACSISDIIAPEHIEIMTEKPFETLEYIKNGGSIFIGTYSPVAVGDYIGGTNHVIPTSGTAVFSSPLGVYDFFKKSSVTYYDYNALAEEHILIEDFAFTENLLAHRNSVKIRIREK